MLFIEASKTIGLANVTARADSTARANEREAAAYCGCRTEAAFDDWIQKGIVPGPIPDTQRWDHKAIDRWLDRDQTAAGSALLNAMI